MFTECVSHRFQNHTISYGIANYLQRSLTHTPGRLCVDVLCQQTHTRTHKKKKVHLGEKAQEDEAVSSFM